MELVSNFIQQAITIFAIMDPIGISALALSLLSPNITKTQINTIARKSTFTIIIAFFVVLITGDAILKIFGIGESSIKVMGGIILLMMAISMVNATVKKGKNDDNKSDEELAIIPIGIPIAFGAGLFTTIIIFKHEASSFVDLISISLAFGVNALLFYLILKNSGYIKKILGVTGQNVVTRLMGLIVGAIAVQFIISGVVNLTKLYM